MADVEGTGAAPASGDDEPGVREVRVLLVDLGGSPAGLPADHVREIVPMMAATRLPGAPARVKGLVNLRGQLVTVVDLSQCLGGAPVTNQDASTVVLEADGRTLGVIVDDVRDVQSVPVSPPAEASVADATGLIGGLGRFEGEVVLVIDVPELVRQSLS